MKCGKVSIHSAFIKLDSFLKFCGVAETGGQAKLMIEEGDVLVDDVVCTMRGKKLYPGMTVKAGNQWFEVEAVEC